MVAIHILAGHGGSLHPTGFMFLLGLLVLFLVIGRRSG